MGHLKARILTCTEAEYFADPCERPSLSQSIAKLLLDKSPRHAHYAHPRLGKGERVERKTFDRGKLVHKLVLGKGAEIAVVEADDWRKKAAQEARDEAYAAGKIPALVGDYEYALTVAPEVHRQIAEQGKFTLANGDAEVAITWREPVAGHATVHCRGMIDNLDVGPGWAVINDLKVSESAHPRSCTSHVLAYGYDIQQAAYTRAIEDIFPNFAGTVGFNFIFVEIGPPVCVTIARLDGAMRERGVRRWARAVETWAECLAFDRWPGYAERPITLEAPPWVLATMSEIDA